MTNKYGIGWHITKAGRTHFDDGYEYAIGGRAHTDFKKAEECFREAIKYGDIEAMEKLSLLILASKTDGEEIGSVDEAYKMLMDLIVLGMLEPNEAIELLHSTSSDYEIEMFKTNCIEHGIDMSTGLCNNASYEKQLYHDIISKCYIGARKGDEKCFKILIVLSDSYKIASFYSACILCDVIKGSQKSDYLGVVLELFRKSKCDNCARRIINFYSSLQFYPILDKTIMNEMFKEYKKTPNKHESAITKESSLECLKKMFPVIKEEQEPKYDAVTAYV